MNIIRSSFQDGKNEALQFIDFECFNKYIQQQDKTLLPVIFEGASAGIALNSIKKTASLNHWNTFYNHYSQSFAKQLHVGLGWALNESKSSLHFLQIIQPQWRWRVVDGYGYYAGLFQRRKILRNKAVPSDVLIEWRSAYLQGLGRSLWYISQGNTEQLIRTIDQYSSSFSKDLWRGVGIALAFVGKTDNETLYHLSTIKELTSLKHGVALAVSSMLSTNEFSSETETIGNYFFDDCKKVSSFVAAIESNMNPQGSNYLALIEEISKRLF